MLFRNDRAPYHFTWSKSPPRGKVFDVGYRDVANMQTLAKSIGGIILSPNRPKQHTINDDGIALIKRMFSKYGWIVRDQSNDYGIDLEIEIAEKSGLLPGLLFKVQVKTHDTIKFTDNTYIEYIKKDTYEYWLNFRVPVYVFVVDLENEQIFVSETIKNYRKMFERVKKNVPVKIIGDKALNLEFYDKRFVHSAMHHNKFRRLHEYSRFILEKYLAYLNLYERIQCSDKYLPMDYFADYFIEHIDYLEEIPIYIIHERNLGITELLNKFNNHPDIDIASIEFYKMREFADCILRIYIEIIFSLKLSFVEEDYYWKAKYKNLFEKLQSLPLPDKIDCNTVLMYYIQLLDRDFLNPSTFA